MSQIKKALEKARAERLNDGAYDPQYVHGPAKPRESGQLVRYPEARIVEVAPEQLLHNRIVSVSDEHEAADHFKLLRTRLFQHTRTKRRTIVQVTGFSSSEGISLVAVNLAISISKDLRQTTLLVDLDFRRPSVHELLGLDPGVEGLKSYFLDGKPLEELFISPSIPKLSVLPAGGRIAHSTEILGSPQMESLLLDLKRCYPDRYVVLDTPGIHTCSDSVVVSEYVDAIVLVARAGKTSEEMISAGIERLPREKIVGVVLNDASKDEVSTPTIQ